MENIQKELLTLKVMADNLEEIFLRQGAPPLVVAAYCSRIILQVMKLQGLAFPPSLGGARREN